MFCHVSSQQDLRLHFALAQVLTHAARAAARRALVRVEQDCIPLPDVVWPAGPLSNSWLATHLSPRARFELSLARFTSCFSLAFHLRFHLRVFTSCFAP